MQIMVLGLDRVAECHYINGPHESGTFDKDIDDGRTWCQDPSHSARPALDAVLEYARQHGPFDGAYAFSQGASIVTLLSDPTVLASLNVEHPPWRFVLLACGASGLAFRQTEPALQPPIALPSLHLHGAADDWLASSRELVGLFDRPRVLEHPYGHALPVQLCGPEHSALLQALAAFVLDPSHAV